MRPAPARPFVSIVIPCRNERAHIAKCLDSVLAQNYPGDRLEILVADGMSTDGTREIVAGYSGRRPPVKLLDNPGRITPKALNTGIRAAAGDFICRLDAHAEYPPGYVSACWKALEESGADNVGGPITTRPRETGLTADSISAVLSSPFGVGNSAFRTGTAAPVWVDTVFGGFYRRAVFDRIGLFNEKLSSSQDIEFNRRLIGAGGRILLHPAITCVYYTRASLGSFFRNNLRNGFWAVFPLRYTRHMPVSARHLVPLCFVSWLLAAAAASFFSRWGAAALAAALVPYCAGALFFSLKAALASRRPAFLFAMPPLFFFLHLVYGLGSLAAAAALLVKGRDLP